MDQIIREQSLSYITAKLRCKSCLKTFPLAVLPLPAYSLQHFLNASYKIAEQHMCKLAEDAVCVKWHQWLIWSIAFSGSCTTCTESETDLKNLIKSHARKRISKYKCVKNKLLMAVTAQFCYSWAENWKMSFVTLIANNIKPSIVALTADKVNFKNILFFIIKRRLY